MPLYEYTCKRCGNFEVMQRISEDPLKKCPTCGSKVSKLISRSAFHLKGSGWYVTDYKKSEANTDKNAESKPAGSETKDKSNAGSSTTESASTAPKDSSPKDSTPKAETFTA